MLDAGSSCSAHTNMEISFLMAGFGGQGVQTLGKVLAYTANEAGKNTTFLPEYGGAMRGGTSNCTVVVGDDEIASPSRRNYNYVVALNTPSYEKFKKNVLPGGTLIVNCSIVDCPDEIDGIKVLKIPGNDLAHEAGSMVTLGVVMIGFIGTKTGVIPLDEAKEETVKRLSKKAQFREMNERAFDLGAAYAG
ncbi:MAG: 2-oxoacid:acceptor oxidoreductase family protein [Selenomonas sp.]|nr:2-oxoacid:acceptor oxidoreductase family protein [Selenomonas sp.]